MREYLKDHATDIWWAVGAGVATGVLVILVLSVITP